MGQVTKFKNSYDGGDIIVSILDVPDISATSIDYDIKQEHQLNYKLGSNKPSSWSAGKEEYSCSLELYLEDALAIQMANGGLPLIRLQPFHIVVTYNPSLNGGLLPPITDRLLVKFQNDGRGGKATEMASKKSFDLFVLDIEFNI